MAGEDLADTEAEPHILIGVDPVLTGLVWRQFGKRPFILTFERSDLPWNSMDRFGKPAPFPAEELIGHLCYGLPNDEAVIRVRTQLDRARRHFDLPAAAPLITAVAGNHSSMCVALRIRSAEGCSSLDHLKTRASLKDRKLSCLVGAALERIGGVELVRLPGNIDPGTRAPEYDCLVAEIRESLDQQEGARLAGRPATILKLPTSVRLYTRRGPAGAWERLTTGVPPLDLPWTEADWLIQNFLDRRIATLDEGQGDLEGVLVKILGTKPSRHSPADTPIITARQIRAARLAGIKAILLDARYGIIVSEADEDEATANLPRLVWGA